ncbi:hypothetical protein [Priestia megaterium]|uniref:hypothetical protein n=1 Tax=Priestia megaterium TaxID=1404 RepID=UPI001BEA0632|nr:hypothetical protein [Priestia megaterium]MBT2258392.1 hypothetical protein [Priestia megaterium]MBT2278488.1 hypothetical protein [Priestia megaterium]
MKWIALILFIIMNIVLVPLAFIIGVFAMNSPDSTMMNFFIGMAYVLAPPNLIFLILYLGAKWTNKESNPAPNKR